MAPKRHIRWLYGELSPLVNLGILDAAVADRLRAHYGPLPERRPGALLLLIFGVLGAGLVGLGIILLLANNWEQMSRPMRAALAIALLLASQGIALYACTRKTPSRALREGAGAFLGLCVGAAIALIGQTYNIPGEMGRFLLTWMLLIFPLMYVLDAGIVTIGYFVGITSWAGYVQSHELHALLLYPMAALAIPHVVMTARRSPYAARTVWMLWTASLCAVVAVGLVLERSLPGLWLPIYTSLFALMYIGGAFWFDDAESHWQRPLYCVGAAGLAVMSLIQTFEDAWSGVGWSYYREEVGYFGYAAIGDYVLTAGLLIGAIALLATAIRRRRTAFLPLGVMPILSTIGFALAAGLDDPVAPWLLFNAYVLAVSVFTIARGVKSDQLGVVNGGLVLLAALVVIRFFDSELPFVARGLAFIGIGLGFLVFNVVLVSRRRASA